MLMKKESNINCHTKHHASNIKKKNLPYKVTDHHHSSARRGWGRTSYKPMCAQRHIETENHGER